MTPDHTIPEITNNEWRVLKLACNDELRGQPATTYVADDRPYARALCGLGLLKSWGSACCQLFKPTPLAQERYRHYEAKFERRDA